MKVWNFFQPNIQKMTILFLMSLLWIMPTWKVATCKICYKQHHGFPITFVILDSSSGLYTHYQYFMKVEKMPSRSIQNASGGSAEPSRGF
jgi:hypothetical protein